MDLRREMITIGQKAAQAARRLSAADSKSKNDALLRLSRLLLDREDCILQANQQDLAAARERNLDAPRLDRLTLTPAAIAEMSRACAQVAGQSDPVGAIENMWKLENGLMAGRMRIPLGVIAIIFESRPNVTIDSAILCLKAGNAVILRGGSEAIHSNMALAGLIHEALTAAGLPADSVQVLGTTDREAVRELLKLEQYVDVIIPRGGEALIRAVVAEATMPVLKHYKGVCHCYVDQGADLDEALEILFNGKCQRPGVCNALEGLLVHQSEAEAFLPMVAKRLGGAGVEFRACPNSLPLLGRNAKAATEDDLGQEFHDLILVVRVVDSQDEAQAYLARSGSNRTEVFGTRADPRAMKFLREVDASLVVVNASSRFNDGGQLGLGAEIGISTSKLHAYGPMGVKELTTTKFVLLGEGQVRS